MTNFKRLTKSHYALADWLVTNSSENCCGICAYGKENDYGLEDCEPFCWKGVMKWLDQKCDEDKEENNFDYYTDSVESLANFITYNAKINTKHLKKPNCCNGCYVKQIIKQCDELDDNNCCCDECNFEWLNEEYKKENANNE